MAVAVSGGINVFNEFSGETRVQFIDGMAEALLLAGWTLRTRLRPTLTFDLTHITNPSDGDNFAVDTITYTWKATVDNSVAGQVKIGAATVDSYTNLASAVNRSGGSLGTLYSDATNLNPTIFAAVDGLSFSFFAKRPGPYGNGLSTRFGVLVGGGYRIAASSPQSLPALVDIYDRQTSDTFGNQFVFVKMLSDVDPTIFTREHSLRVMDEVLSTTSFHDWSASVGMEVDVTDAVDTAQDGHWFIKQVGADFHIFRKYLIIANRCQFFVFPHGVDHDEFGSIICGGVPFVNLSNPASPVTCHGEVAGTPGVEECFWLSGDSLQSAPHCTYRTAVVRASHVYDADIENQGTGDLHGVGVWGGSDAVYNGVLMTGGDAASGRAPFHFGPVAMTPTNDFNFAVAFGAGEALVSSIKWWGDVPFELEPLIAWSIDGGGSNPVIVGQLYDAFIRTQQENMDLIQTHEDGTNWYAVTNKSKFGTLWMLVSGVPRLQASYAH